MGSFLRDSVDGTQQAAICVSEPGDILTRFSDQKVGGQGHSRQRLPVEFNLVIFHFLIIKFIFSSLFMHRFGSDSTFMAREIFTVFFIDARCYFCFVVLNIFVLVTVDSGCV